MSDANTKIHLVSIDSDICEDDFTEGDGDSTGAGLQGDAIGRTFPNMDAAVKFLASNYGLSDKVDDYEDSGSLLQTDKAVANHSEAQNGGWFEPTEQEIADWKAGKIKLYTEHTTIRYITTP